MCRVLHAGEVSETGQCSYLEFPPNMRRKRRWDYWFFLSDTLRLNWHHIFGYWPQQRFQGWEREILGNGKDHNEDRQLLERKNKEFFDPKTFGNHLTRLKSTGLFAGRS